MFAITTCQELYVWFKFDSNNEFSFTDEDEKAATQKAILEAHERIRKEISSVRYKLSAAATEIRKIKKLIHLESMIHL